MQQHTYEDDDLQAIINPKDGIMLVGIKRIKMRTGKNPENEKGTIAELIQGISPIEYAWVCVESDEKTAKQELLKMIKQDLKLIKQTQKKTEALGYNPGECKEYTYGYVTYEGGPFTGQPVISDSLLLE